MDLSEIREKERPAFQGRVSEFHIAIHVFDNLLTISLISEVSFEEFHIVVDQ